MESNFKIITDFIYKQPDVVVAVLKDSGYDISAKNATLHSITKLTLEALANNDQTFATKLAGAMDNDGQINILPLVGIGVSVVTSVISGISAKKEAKRQLELQKQLFLADQAFEEKLFYEQLQMQAETDRTKILANSLLEYRKTLQSESTKRLDDTKYYIAFIALSLMFFVGVYKLLDKK